MKPNYYSLQAIFCALGVFFISSCKNVLNQPIESPPPTQLAQPLVSPLTLSKPVKLNLDTIRAVPITPAVQHFDIDKLPSRPYDSSGFKPYSKPVTETAFDFNHLPEKDLDVDKLPSRPLNFKTYVLPAPRLVKANIPSLKNARSGIYECGEGLPGTFNNITTDKDGFLWVATTNGIYRYDGENYVLYVPGDGSRVVNIMADNMGRIWFDYLTGELKILDPKKGTLKVGNFGVGLTRYLTDGRNRVWVNTLGTGTHIIDPDLRTEKLLDKPQGLPGSMSWAIGKDGGGNIWISTVGSGISIIDLNEKKIKYLDNASGLKLDTITGMVRDHAGRIWLGAGSNGLVACADAQRGSVQYIHETVEPGMGVYEMIEDNAGHIWLGTQNKGVAIIDPPKKVIKRYNTADGLAGNQIYSMVKDKYNQVWLSTSAGLSRVGAGGIVKDNLRFNEGTITEDGSGLIWMGEPSNVVVLDRNTKMRRQFGVRQGLSNANIQLVTAVNDEVFIGTNGGLDIVDKKNKTMSHLTRRQGLTNLIVDALTICRDGLIWLGGDTWIDIYDPVNHTVKHIGKNQGLTDGATGVYSIQEDRQRRMWISYDRGQVDIIDRNAQTVRHVEKMQYNSGAACILQMDGNGNMWIGSTKGLQIVNLNKMTSTSITTAQGLADNDVTSLLFRNKQMYVSTIRGISVIAPPAAPGEKWEIKTFGAAYGVRPNTTGYFLADLITKDGLYWRSNSDLSVLDLSKTDTTFNHALIAGIRIMDEPQHFTDSPASPGKDGLENKLSGPFNLPEHFELPYDQNFLQFQFSSFNLTRRDSSSYRYKLAGADTGWSQRTNENTSRNYNDYPPFGLRAIPRFFQCG